MLVNEFVFKEELLKRIHQILINSEDSIEFGGVEIDAIPSENIPIILRDISREIDKLTKSDENVNFGVS